MNSQPPKISPINSRLVAALVAVIVVTVAAVLFFFNPSLYHFYPTCQFHRLTGLSCPGCGGTRAVYALLHGDFLTAIHDNALFVAALVVAMIRGAWFALNRLRTRPNGPFCPPYFLIPAVVIMVVFGILRNLPAFSFFRPL